MPTTSEDVMAITERLYALARDVRAKTGGRPWSGPDLTISGRHCVIVLYPFDTGSPALGVFKGDTPCAAFDAAETFVAAMPDLATAQINAHVRVLTDSIEIASAAGVNPVDVASLASTVAAISALLLPAAHGIPMKESA